MLKYEYEGKKLRELRKELRLTIQQVADHMEISSASVSKYERGVVRVPERLQSSYSDLLNTSWESIQAGAVELVPKPSMPVSMSASTFAWKAGQLIGAAHQLYAVWEAQPDIMNELDPAAKHRIELFLEVCRE